MYTKVYDYVLKVNPDTWQSDLIFTTKIPDVIYTYDSQFTLLRFCVTPTLPVSITLSSVDVVWREFSDPNKTVLVKTKAIIYNGYICVVLPIALAKNVTTGGYAGGQKYEFTLIGNTDSDELLMFGIYEIGVVKFTGMEEVRENLTPDDLPPVDTNPMITLLNSDVTGGGDGGSGGDGGPITKIKDYTCYSVDKKTATVGITQQISEYPYVAITDDLDDVNNIDWFCNPNHAGKLLDGLYTESQNFCMFDWATFVLTSTNKYTSRNVHAEGQISSGSFSHTINDYVPDSSFSVNIDEDDYLKYYYYRSIIGSNTITGENTTMFCTSTLYNKTTGSVPVNFNDFTLPVSFTNGKLKVTDSGEGKTGYAPKTTTAYLSFNATNNNIVVLLAKFNLEVPKIAVVISDYILLANDTMFKKPKPVTEQAYTVNDVIAYTKKVKKEGWY